MVNFINLQLKLEGIDEETQFDFITINRNAALVHSSQKKNTCLRIENRCLKLRKPIFVKAN